MMEQCPYCADMVDRTIPYEIHRAPDEGEQPSLTMGGEAELAEDMTFATVSCKKMLPCGHIFKLEHIDEYDHGLLTVKQLGDRVVNPRGDRQ